MDYFEFRVLYTDYDVALVFSCKNYFSVFNLQYFWILSRKPYINENKLNDLEAILRKNKIDTSYLTKNDLIGCV